MSDEKPVAETLETIAAKIDALHKASDERFAQIDDRFAQIDDRFAQIDNRFAQIDNRSAKVDDRFAKIDKRFDEIKDEIKTQLRVEIEAVNANVMRVYDAVIAQTEINKANVEAHKAFEKRMENHEVRILALERPKRGRTATRVKRSG